MSNTGLLGVNRTKRSTVPPTKISPGEERGKVHWYYDEYTWSTNSVIGDVVTMMKIPKGARIVDGVIQSADNGTVGKYDLGFDGGDNGDETADQDGLIPAFNPVDTGGNVATINGVGAAAGAGYGAKAPGAAILKSFADSCNVLLKCTEASDVGTGVTVKVAIAVVFD